ncbi:hypothetical protein FACS1894151_00870 [Spirochaetia bacterium]|nr:hypothetical protein FACS1894151_00870 [Spirochaetia bacterium]
MFTRINKIKQVGTFKNFATGGKIPFADNEKISVVYGLNTYGKSTLTAIFNSLSKNDIEDIVSRKTIPTSQEKQYIEMLYKASENQSSDTIKFDGNQWKNNNIKDKILVFDQGFIHRNIISGDEITHENKENFTDFILGEKGVSIGSDIESKNKELRQLSSQLKLDIPLYVKNKTEKEIDTFVNLIISESSNELESQKESIEISIHRTSKTNEFLAIDIPTLDINSYLSHFNKLKDNVAAILNKSYDNIADESQRILESHLAKDCNGDKTVREWIRKGIIYSKNDICPFCSQRLETVSELIAAYRAIFNVNYDNYINDLQKELTDCKLNYSIFEPSVLSIKIQQIIGVIEQYKPFIIELERKTSCLRESIVELQIVEEKIRRLFVTIKTSIDNLLMQKMGNAHKKMDYSIDDSGFISLINEADRIISQCKINIDECINIITVERNKLVKETKESLQRQMESLQNSLNKIEEKIARIVQVAECENYKTTKKQIGDLKAEIKALDEKLQTEQSDYLEKYFERLNYWFKRFGSSNFMLSRIPNHRGNKVVYGLKTVFCNVEIPQENIKKVFSESDRRNLAFSIFLTSAEYEQKSNTILILDDPVVSFDDNRIQMTCRVISEIFNDFEQIIILTHYMNLILGLVNLNVKAKYLQINNNENGAKLNSFDISDIILSDHEKVLIQIHKFIDRIESDTSIFLKFRPFMEQHLKIIYQEQMLGMDVSSLQLSGLIDKLADNNLISPNNKNKLHRFRESLNPEHHVDKSLQNIESMRQEAKELIDLLYGDLRQ